MPSIETSSTNTSSTRTSSVSADESVASDAEVATLRAAFAAAPAEEPLLDAIRTAVVSVNHYTATDVPELRARMKLISTVPALQASAATHYDAWERAVIDYAAGRLGQP